MGNNNSRQPPPSSVDVVRRPPSRPGAPPSARPISELGPRGPSYHAPENQVLPKELPIMRLRPVSMELSKYHPEYQDIFMGENKENDNESDDKENNKMNGDVLENMKNNNLFPERPPPPLLNGHIPRPNSQTQTVSVSPMPNEQQVDVNLNIKNKSSVPYRPSHKRQTSLNPNLTGQEHTIIEEPEESIDNRTKLDPLMQSYPGATGPSLPVKNNFNLDYSYQLTYVQLAEHRRNKTIEELEKRTGKKLSDLSADLNENMEQPNAFKRGAGSRASSKSLGSSGSAVSSKKKKAPPPPSTNTLPSSKPNTPREPPASEPYSLENEPPADYDMESPRRNVVLPRYAAIPPVPRVTPSHKAGPPAPPAPPPPPAFNGSRTNTNLKRNNSMSNGTPEIILKRTPSVKSAEKTPDITDGHIPWLLEIKNLSEARANRRQVSFDTPDPLVAPADTPMETLETEEIQTVREQPNTDKTHSKLVYESSKTDFIAAIPDFDKQEPETKVVGASLERNNSLKSPKKPASPKLQRYHSTSTYDHQSTPSIKRQISVPEPSPKSADPVRRLSSLLQHDIKAVANAKCLKIVKQTTPVPPKPKDPHTVFREQLQKACLARDNRTKTDGTIDEKLKRSASEENAQAKLEDNVAEENDVNVNRDSETTNHNPDSLHKPPRYHKNVHLNKASSNYRKSRQMTSFADDNSSAGRKQNNRGSAALDWTPEDDLDSDDNLSDRESMSTRKGASDGFKSTIIPNAVTDLKGRKYAKAKTKSKDVVSPDESNKNKFGSVKKFKKNVHKSVKNAFGSISKASGKLLRKQKPEDLEVTEDVPNNWKLTAGTSRMNGNGSLPSLSSTQYATNGFDYDSDENIENGVSLNGHNGVLSNGANMSEQDSSDSEDRHRTVEYNGKAYKNNKKGSSHHVENGGFDEADHHVYHTDDDSEEEHISKLKEKKKKADSISRRKERDSGAMRGNEEQREKERRLEEERRKQLEMELEYHKARERETRERLQRLESAHLQQQINAQLYQQQQQQNISMLSAPPLPPAGTFPPNYTIPEAAQTQNFGALFGQQLPQNNFSPQYGLFNPQNGPAMNGSAPFDLNDYMRMLGLQTPPTSQQMAFFLNSMTLTGQPFERKSNPTLFNVLNPDPLKQYPSASMNYPMMDTNVKSPNFPNWSSTPNIPVASSVNNMVPRSDFVTNYNSNGAKVNSSEPGKDSSQSKQSPRNPLYSSDDSDAGLSPQKTVARSQVEDFRPTPVTSESNNFMRQYAGDVQISIAQERLPNSDMLQNSKSVSNNDGLARRQRSASPSESTSTIDSAVSAPLSSPSLPPTGSSSSPSVESPSPRFVARSEKIGFKTVLDLTTENGSTHISMVDTTKRKTSK